MEEVDLLALAAEECARYDGCVLDGEAVTLHGDARLLRRLLRNLLDNAQRHGRRPVRVELRRDGLIAHADPEYALSPLGRSFLGPMMAIHNWTQDHIDEVEQARRTFDAAEPV